MGRRQENRVEKPFKNKDLTIILSYVTLWMMKKRVLAMNKDEQAILQALKVLKAVAEGRRILYTPVMGAKFAVYPIKSVLTYSIGTLAKFEIEE